MHSPLVSVITATYNRGNVLRHTIASLLASTFQEWELIVVGDACTDDTAEVVGSFDDPRIRFVNLEKNHGEQSGPNNAGIRLARGRYVAFLNHDDLWTPDHLAVCVAEIERTAADVVFTLAISVTPFDTFLSGASRDGTYDPSYILAPASSWLVRREAFETVGEWRDARSIHLVPSQEWLFRAWKRGLKIRAIEKATVIAVQSGASRNSYRDRHDDVNRECADALRTDPRFIETLLTRAAVRSTLRWRGGAVLPLIARAAKNAMLRLVFAVGRHPLSFTFWLRYRTRGGSVDALRRVRGLPPLERTP